MNHRPISSRLRRCLLTLTLSLAAIGLANADEKGDFFESKIRPLLAKHCLECHANEGPEAELRLTSRENLLKPAESGESPFNADNPAESRLLAAIRYDGDTQMPPAGKLSDEEIAYFEKWILDGAVWPKSGTPIRASGLVISDSDRQHWAFRPAASPPTPSVTKTDWVRTPIDAFVLAKLEAAGLSPNPPADRRTLFRRLSYDVTGLPPTETEMAEFLADQSPDAYERAVERLLASPRYGERWGRHWMDVARYADTKDGVLMFGADRLRPFAYTYRDYVIRALNEDIPYDQFIREQLAADLIQPAVESWRLGALGFLTLGRMFDNNVHDIIDDQIDTTTRGFLGLTVSCARCHDHKFDPIPQSDYYALAGIFQSTETFFGGTRSQRNRQPSDWIRLPVQDPETSKPVMSTQDLAELKKELQQRQEELVEARRAQRTGINPPGLNPNLLDLVVSQLRARISSVDDLGRTISVCMGTQDRQSLRNARVLIRGEIDQPAQEIPRGFVQVLVKEPAKIPAKSSGRLELANWLADKNNPLTARVMVNRIWQQLIGKGIVREPDNFGVSGPSPTHRELLDFLAYEFMENNWSIKHMVRSIATSRTYRLATTYDSQRFEADPENLWIARGNAKRLSAEAIRDSMLSVSGSINLNPPKSSVFASMGSAIIGPNGPQNIPLVLAPGGTNDERSANLRRLLGGGLRNPSVNLLEIPNYYRSVYLPVGRNLIPRALDVFDFADPNSVTGLREVSNTADQALFMLNNPFVIELSDAFARRVVQSTQEPQARVQRAFELAYGRSASPQETQASLSFVRKAKESQDQVASDEANFKAWSQFCQALMASAEFRIQN